MLLCILGTGRKVLGSSQGTILAHSLSDFLKIVPWCPRGSVAGFPWVVTFDLVHLCSKSSHY